MPKNKKWAWEHNECIKCHSTEYPHKALGLCTRCYKAVEEHRHKAHNTAKPQRGLSAEALTYEYLNDLYNNQNMSLSQIAVLVNCTRQYVNKRMNALGIPKRNYKEAQAAVQKTRDKMKAFNDTYTQRYVEELLRKEDEKGTS